MKPEGSYLQFIMQGIPGTVNQAAPRSLAISEAQHGGEATNVKPLVWYGKVVDEIIHDHLRNPISQKDADMSLEVW